MKPCWHASPVGVHPGAPPLPRNRALQASSRHEAGRTMRANSDTSLLHARAETTLDAATRPEPTEEHHRYSTGTTYATSFATSRGGEHGNHHPTPASLMI